MAAMHYIIGLAILLAAAFYFKRGYQKAALAKRQQRIDEYRFPVRIKHKLVEKYPHLKPLQVEQVIRGLREYFQLCNIAGKRMVSMPSQAVDVAWHEFILYTRQYEQFCDHALGRFLHHTPAEAMPTPTMAQTGIKRAWRLSCLRENIKPTAPAMLPLLFAIDSELAIPDGFKYALDCLVTGGDYCAGHIGCGSGCGGDSCDSNSGCDAGGDSGCGGGCGGD